MVEESQKCCEKRGEERLRMFELFFPLIVSILTKHLRGDCYRKGFVS